MRSLLYDASKLAVSMAGVGCKSLECCKKIIKNRAKDFIKECGFITREEFDVFAEIAKNSNLSKDMKNIVSNFNIQDENIQSESEEKITPCLNKL